MESEFLLELESETEEPFIPCLFCLGKCGNHPPMKSYGMLNQDSKLGLFCQAFNLTEDSFEEGLRISPLCPNCLTLIERIGGMLEMIQELELKLNLEKETVLDLLRQDLLIHSPEDQLCPNQPYPFSPVQFRGDIQKKLNILPHCEVKQELDPNSVIGFDLDLDLEDPPDPGPYFPSDSEDEVEGRKDELFPQKRRSSSSEPLSIKNRSHEEIPLEMEEHLTANISIVEKGQEENIEEVEECLEKEQQGSIIKYSLPAGVVLKDLSVRLERLKEMKNKKSKKIRSLRRNPVRIIGDSRKKQVRVKRTKTEATEEEPREKRTRGRRRKVETEKPEEITPHAATEVEAVKKIKRRRRRRPDDQRVEGKPCKCDDALEGKCNRFFLFTEYNLKIAHYKEVKARWTGICAICGIECKTRKQLLRHRIEEHGEPYPIYCQEEGCGEGLLHAEALKHHMYTHTGDYPFRCDQCNLGFPNTARFKEHMDTHSTSLDFVCEVCGKTFKSRKLVNEHQKYHREDKAFKCTMCDAAFKVSSGLASHIHCKHSEAKPFLCQECGKAFKTKHILKVHIRGRHSGIEKVRKVWRKSSKSNPDLDLNLANPIPNLEIQPPEDSNNYSTLYENISSIL